MQQRNWVSSVFWECQLIQQVGNLWSWGKKAGAESFALTVDGLSGVGVSQTCQGKVNLKVKPRTDQSPYSTPLPFGPALNLPRPPLPPPPLFPLNKSNTLLQSGLTSGHMTAGFWSRGRRQEMRFGSVARALVAG